MRVAAALLVAMLTPLSAAGQQTPSCTRGGLPDACVDLWTGQALEETALADGPGVRASAIATPGTSVGAHLRVPAGPASLGLHLSQMTAAPQGATTQTAISARAGSGTLFLFHQQQGPGTGDGLVGMSGAVDVSDRTRIVGGVASQPDTLTPRYGLGARHRFSASTEVSGQVIVDRDGPLAADLGIRFNF